MLALTNQQFSFLYTNMAKKCENIKHLHSEKHEVLTSLQLRVLYTRFYLSVKVYYCHSHLRFTAAQYRPGSSTIFDNRCFLDQ